MRTLTATAPSACWESAGAHGGRIGHYSVTEVFGVDVAPRGTNWRDGSRRHPLRVTRASGDAELLVVGRPEKAVDLIERARHGVP